MGEEIFKYYPFKSHVHPSFWHKLSEVKINLFGLSDKETPIYGFYTNKNTQNCLMEVDYSSFNSEFTTPNASFKSHGLLYNKNTIEDFKSCDKQAFLELAATKFWQNIENGDCIKDSSLLVFFAVLSFADLKKHNFYFWFAFPACSEPVLYKSAEPAAITSVISKENLVAFNREYFSRKPNVGFFIAEIGEIDFEIKHLHDRINIEDKTTNFQNADLTTTYFCFADPCEFETPGWVLRNFVMCLTYWCPSLHGKTIKLVSVRVSKASLSEKSLVYEISLPTTAIKPDDLKWIGWERNEQGNFGPKLSKLGNTMDPVKLAENSVNLNLKLMKWRLVPNLDLDIISNAKCLLLGAGTLGCAVARSLMAWGCNTITFVDSGNVSYSNPVRQYLYTHKDAMEKKPKALAAEQHIKEIHPGMTSKGYVLDIPMPGHPVGESMNVKTNEHIDILSKLIEAHDVVFLLTDSRESRWLPTLLGYFYDKIVITAALGFDSYLVLRHGSRSVYTPNSKTTNIDGLKCINGNELGCYFCNDITAPGNSMKDRTLDQQCTVTRPAVSNIAASLAVELLVTLLQHKDKQKAPAYLQSSHHNNSQSASIPEGLLGIIPHSIRGSLSVFEQILPATERFMQCIACSEKVLNEFKSHGSAFLIDTFNSSAKFLEDLTGITEMMEGDPLIMDFDDDDDDLDCSD